MLIIDNETVLLKCMRNELVPQNPKTTYDLKGLLKYRTNNNFRHQDSLYEGYDNRKNYSLYFFREFKSGLYDGEANAPLDMKEINDFTLSIERAIDCIEKRAGSLIAAMNSKVKAE